MDIREMQMFVAVAEEGSIRRGAQRLSIAQPYLSQCIRKLERELAVDLLQRSTRGVTVTAAGELLLTQARQLITQVDRVVAELSELGRKRRTLRIGLLAGPVAAAELTQPILSRFRATFPQFDLELQELTFANQFDEVATGRLDAAIVRPPLFDNRLVAYPLFTEPRVLCMRKGHRLSAHESVAAAEIIDETFVDLSQPHRQWSDFWLLNDLRDESAHIRSDGAVTLSQLAMTLLCEDVVVTAAASAWRLGLNNPMLTAVPIVDVAPSEIAIAVRKGERRSEVMSFVECAYRVSAAIISMVPGAALSTATASN